MKMDYYFASKYGNVRNVYVFTKEMSFYLVSFIYIECEKVNLNNGLHLEGGE